MVFPSSQRSIQSCPAGQLHNSKEVGRTKTKDLSSYFLERGAAPLKKCREATKVAQTGWSERRNVSPNRPPRRFAPPLSRLSLPRKYRRRGRGADEVVGRRIGMPA